MVDVGGSNPRLRRKASSLEKWLTGATEDLKAHAGKSLVVAGYRQPESVHQLAHIINDALGNNGKTVTFHKTPANEFGSLADLASDLGKFDRVVNLGCNLVYDGGTDVDGSKAIVKKTAFRLTDYAEDESHSVKGVNAPRAHYLESWGDARMDDGTIVPVQPLIAPLFGAMTELEVLAVFAAGEGTSPRTGHEVVQSTFSGDS